MNNVEKNETVVVFINVDGINQLQDNRTDAVRAEYQVSEAIAALRSVMMSLDAPVVCLVAGATRRVLKAFSRSGVELEHFELPQLSGSDIATLMQNCHVDQRYLSNPAFQQLLDDTGGVPGILRKVVEGLTFEYSRSSIETARKEARAYLTELRELSTDTKLLLLPYVLFGLELYFGGVLDDLLKDGIIFRDENYRVSMPMLLFSAMCEDAQCNAESTVTFEEVSALLHDHRTKDWEHWERFCVRYHSLKLKYYASRSIERVTTLKEFYEGVPMSAALQYVQIGFEKSATFPSRRTVHVGSDAFYNGRGVQADGSIANTKSKDFLCLCISQTLNSAGLTRDKIESDRKKAIESFASIKGAKVITVHISNAPLAEGVNAEQKNSIIISKEHLYSFFGPTMSRGLYSGLAAQRKRSRSSDGNAQSVAIAQQPLSS